MIAELAIATIISTSSIAADIDTDKDGLSDRAEQFLNTLTDNADSDGDGFLDGEEVKSGHNPLNSKKGNRQADKRVEIDLSAQQIHYYFNNVKIGSYYVSTGRLTAKTPTGTFKILRKLPVHNYRGINVFYPNTKWNLEFKPHYFIHSAYWHNDFGVKPRSGGCVNLTVPDAEQIYKFLDVGNKVVIYGKTPTKLLPKPSGMTITNAKSAAVKSG